MPTYTNISLEEFDAFVSPLGFKLLPFTGDLKRCKEYVYGRRHNLRSPLNGKLIQASIRIYTGIDATGQSRDCGKDAIRIVWIVRLNEENRLIPVIKMKRVHRVKNWRNNLKTRLQELQHKFHDLQACQCGFLMHKITYNPRKHKKPFNDFYACYRTACKFTRPA